MNIYLSYQKVKEVVHSIIKVEVYYIAFILLALSTSLSAAGFESSNAEFPIVDSTEIYTVVDEMPEIKGGLSEVYKHIEYPRAASNRGVEGRVFIKFVVTENGDVENPEILKDIGSGCGDAAIKGIKKIKFTPGKHQGKAVKVYYTMPINFKLKN